MPMTEEQFVTVLDEIIDETLDLKKQDRVRFTNALLQLLREEDVLQAEEEESDGDADEREPVDFRDD